MALEAPNLDNRTYDELRRLALQRIPQYTPEWTDLNPSDPGVTLVELFAFLTETLLFQLNQVPDRNYVKFLQLLGMRLEPPRPAVAHLTFTAQPGAGPATVPARTRVGAQVPSTGDLLVFETDGGFDLIRPALASVLVYDGTSYSERLEANTQPGVAFRPLGWIPQSSSALYLGFAPPEPLPATGLFPDELRFRVLLPTTPEAVGAARCRAGAPRPTPPVRLVWEFKPGPDPKRWRKLDTHEDESVAFTREGYIRVQGPGAIAPFALRKDDPPLLWLRCRLVEGSYPAGQEPEIDMIQPNTMSTRNLSTVRDELLDPSEGHPDQTFQLLQTPVQPDSLVLLVEEEQEEGPKRWKRVDDFLAAGPKDEVFQLDPTTGTISFGDGDRGRIPVAGARLLAREYRFGGGEAGNRAEGEINAMLDSVPEVAEVTNLRKAVGGAEEQRVEDLRRDAPEVLRHQNRAVTAADYAALARRVGGVAGAVAIPLAHPDHPGVKVPGAVTVAVAADSKDVPPAPSADLLADVCAQLDAHRLLTTELYVASPKFLKVKVEAKVSAQPYASLDEVRRNVQKALVEALDPLQAEGGPPFGRDLFPTSLYAVILAVAEVRAVLALDLRVDAHPHQPATDPVQVPDDGLVFGPDHEIVVVPATEL
jgi:predicted phage baseplate assembly protein